MVSETDFGVNIGDARIGNPLLYVRRIFLCVISSFFAQDCLVDYPGAPPNPYRLICDPRGGISSESKIFISDIYSEGAAARRPQIIIGRGTATWGDLAIGDLGQGFGAYASHITKQTKTDFLNVPLSVSVYGQNMVEVENIGWAVGFCIKMFEPEIREGSLITKIESAVIGPAVPDKVSESYEQFKIELQFNTTIVIIWRRSSTLNREDLKCGLTRISGSSFPVSIQDLCVVAKPVDAPEGWQ